MSQNYRNNPLPPRVPLPQGEQVLQATAAQAAAQAAATLSHPAAETVAERPDMRGEMRAEPRVRARNRPSGTDRFYIPVDRIPHGESWEFKRTATAGQPDPYHQQALYENGWLPVDPRKHPWLLPAVNGGAPAPSTYEIDGMILMERPMELTLEARREDEMRATGQVRDNDISLQRAPTGEERVMTQKVREATQVRRTIESGVDIPD